MEWIIQRISFSEAAKPGVPLDPYSKALLAKLWMRTLVVIGEERFDAALLMVLEKSTFRPDIAEIRKAAGIPSEDQALEEEAWDAFNAIIAAMRTNTPRLKLIKGKVLNDRDPADGRLLPKDEWEREPDLPAPVFSEVIEAAIALIGCRDRQAGLNSLAEHPAMYDYWREKGEELPAIGFAEKNTKDIEARWQKKYALARRRLADAKR